MDKDKQRIEDDLYKAVYDLSYVTHKRSKGVTSDALSLEPEDAITQLKVQAGDIELSAILAGSSEQHVRSIIQRAEIDALLALSDDKVTKRYKECYLLLGTGDIPGRVLFTTGVGDAQPEMRRNTLYSGLRLPDFGIVLHLYRSKEIDEDNATALALKMAKKGKLGQN